MYFKWGFIVALIIAAFVMTPNLGGDLKASCMSIKSSIDDTSKNMRDSFKEQPLIPPKK
jgi:archaellum component FlaG (FlaF/FlaG flagellin family)